MRTTAIIALAGGLLAAGCQRSTPSAPRPRAATAVEPEGGALATFAGGCFWCMEPPFERIDGVLSVVSGYTGGEERTPSYARVASGRTGHAEAVQIRYDPARVPYRRLLEVFWRQIDPTDGGGQFADRGSQYRTAIFYHSPEQRRLAEASRAELARSGRFGKKPIVTQILPAKRFHAAETYHQDYYRRNPARYKRYRRGSGREGFLKKTWKSDERRKREKTSRRHRKPGDAELRRKLTPLQYQVTQRDGTEPPFKNAFWSHKRRGIYVDVVSGEPLFGSHDKYASGSGWPSFTRPLERRNIVLRADRSRGMVRTEVRSRRGDSHLGHLFADGSVPTGQRFCINSAALRFIPEERLAAEGYGRYASLFKKSASP